MKHKLQYWLNWIFRTYRTISGRAGWSSRIIRKRNERTRMTKIRIFLTLTPKPTGMIFQWGPNTGIANFAHCYYRISSNLQNFGPQSPLEWYFNGVQTLAMLILRIAFSLWVQECKIPATISPQIEWYFNGVLTLSILHILMALWFQSSGHHSLLVWYFNGVLAWLILNIPIPLWFKISCHISHWNDT